MKKITCPMCQAVLTGDTDDAVMMMANEHMMKDHPADLEKMKSEMTEEQMMEKTKTMIEEA